MSPDQLPHETVQRSGNALSTFGLFIRDAGQLSDRELLRRLGYPARASAVEESYRSGVGVHRHGEWLDVGAWGGNSYGLFHALSRPCEMGETLADDAPHYFLDDLIEDFDVFTHLLPDTGYDYRFELYRDGALARRVQVDEVEPWGPETFVKVNLGERLAGEPSKPPLDGRAHEIIEPVLEALGAISSAKDSPFELRYYAVDTLSSL